MADQFLERFEAKYEPVTETGCWIWIGASADKEYGQIRFQGKQQQAHRVSYQIFKGAIPEGMHVCHRCDTTFCVNPNHLFLGTHQDNVDDKVAKGRQLKGSQINTARLTEEQIREIRGSLEKPRFIAKQFGIKAATVWFIRNNRIWKHIQ